jgi:hypothetical protein
MRDMRKITAFIPRELLATAQECTGAGVAETLRINRALLLAKGLRAALATLIAQCCIDSGVALVARDRDYRHFV